MNIPEYFSKMKMSLDTYASLLGVSQTTALSHKKGKSVPRKKLAKKLQRLTKGLITCEDIYESNSSKD